VKIVNYEFALQYLVVHGKSLNRLKSCHLGVQFSAVPCHFDPLMSKYCPQDTVFSHPQSVRGRVLHLYRTISKIIFLYVLTVRILHTRFHCIYINNRSERGLATRHRGALGERKYSFYSFLTSTLEGGKKKRQSKVGFEPRTTEVGCDLTARPSSRRASSTQFVFNAFRHCLALHSLQCCVVFIRAVYIGVRDNYIKVSELRCNNYSSSLICP
jgi:hypothetical protein